MPCAGNKSEICGGRWANSVYRVDSSSDNTVPTINNGFNLKLELKPKALQYYDLKMKNIIMNEKKRLNSKGIKVNDIAIKEYAKRALINSLTLEEYVNALSEESKGVLKRFYNIAHKRAGKNFDIFYRQHKKDNLDQLIKNIQSQDKIKTKSKKGQISHQGSRYYSSTICPPTPEPIISDISKSKLIIKRSYDCEKRYTITTPDQSIYLRGSNSSSYYPNHGNDYCNNCCGPAAGQNILEWFNVKVKNGNGIVQVSPPNGPNGIQQKLANLMETTDGVDYTHPDDLSRTLERSDFLGNKGYCYQDGKGKLSQIYYMLSRGTPVILLLAKDTLWAHYITLFGYDADKDKFLTANYRDLNTKELLRLWNFTDISWAAYVGYKIASVHPNTLFSYSPEGCETPWDYHVDLNGFSGKNLINLYFQKFQNDYVMGENENGKSLNFFALPSYLTNNNFSLSVSDGGESISLKNTNTNILSGSMPQNQILGDNSIGSSYTVEAYIDRNFLDKYPELNCGFYIYNENGTVITQSKQFCKNMIDSSAPASDSYVIKYTHTYDRDQSMITFVLHGGFRSISWLIRGCNYDNDGDGLCDNKDNDDDNDGILDLTDNCPFVANANQVDNDHNGKGIACDQYERCLAQCDPTHPLGTTACNYICDHPDFDFAGKRLFDPRLNLVPGLMPKPRPGLIPRPRPVL